MKNSDNLAATDWVGARGDKWRSMLEGMEGMLKPIDDPLIDALALDAPRRIADIGCGGGGTTLDILRRAHEGSVIHGYDISPALIEVARRRMPSGESAVAFEMRDMAQAPPPAVLYERLVSRFGVMFFDDPQGAFSNLASWLAPGGRFAFAVWASPKENPWIGTAREIVANIVDMPASDPEAPGPFRYGDVQKLVTLLDRAGLAELDVQSWGGALPIGGGLRASDAATFALGSFSTFSELLASGGQNAFEAAQKALTDRYARHERDGVVWMDALVRIVTGTRI